MCCHFPFPCRSSSCKWPVAVLVYLLAGVLEAAPPHAGCLKTLFPFGCRHWSPSFGSQHDAKRETSTLFLYPRLYFLPVLPHELKEIPTSILEKTKGSTDLTGEHFPPCFTKGHEDSRTFALDTPWKSCLKEPWPWELHSELVFASWACEKEQCD